jgi:succinate dehydrogenase hydrophobic anchor subunit
MAVESAGVKYAGILSALEKLPIVSEYARTRGWSFVLSWCQRISGLILVAFTWYHIYTLSSLTAPEQFQAKMKVFGVFVFVFLEWALAIPVIFHAFNGGRVILYESFEKRNEESMIQWVLGLSLLYLALLAFLMLLGGQTVSAVFFWLTMIAAGLVLAYGVTVRAWPTAHSRLWKMQRISGAYMLVMISAHMLFMHLNYAVGHDAATVIARLQNYFIKFVDLTLVLAALYHGGYGLVTVYSDYIGSSVLRTVLAALVTAVMLIFAWAGVKLIFVI